MLKNFSVLIPDGESDFLIYVINSLSQIEDVDIYIMSNLKYLFTRYSRHIRHFSYYPKTMKNEDWIANIDNEIKRYQIDLIMPIDVWGIETLIRYKEKLLFKDKLCLLSDFNNFKKSINKWNLTEHLLANGIPFPKSVLYTKNSFLITNTLIFPVILKPILGSKGGEGVLLFNRKEELKDYLQDNKFEDDQIIQEYVRGYDIGCSVLCKSGAILAFTIQKATLLNSNPFKPLLGVEFVYDEKLFKTIEKLMMSLNWNGVAHIDLKFDEINNTFKVLEINPRFWGSLDASMIAGVNFPYLYCLASFNEDFDIPNYKHIKYLNLKGLVKSIIKKKSLVFNFGFILNNTQIKYMIKDPIPVMFKYIIFSKNIIVSKLKKLNISFR